MDLNEDTELFMGIAQPTVNRAVTIGKLTNQPKRD